MTAPVGVRDPFTLEALGRAAIPAVLVGRLTLFSRRVRWRRKPAAGRRLVFSLSRVDIPGQPACCSQLRRRWEVSALVHEPYERAICRPSPASPSTPSSRRPPSSASCAPPTPSSPAACTRRCRPSARARAPSSSAIRPTRLGLLTHLGVPIRIPLAADLLETLPELRAPDAAVFERVASCARPSSATPPGTESASAGRVRAVCSGAWNRRQRRARVAPAPRGGRSRRSRGIPASFSRIRGQGAIGRAGRRSPTASRSWRA